MTRIPARPGPAGRAPPRRRRRARHGARRHRGRRRPCRPARDPTSNCGLTSARQSNSGATQPSTAGSTLPREMNETSTTTRSGRTAARRRSMPGVLRARSPSRAGPGAAASRARRRRRRPLTTAAAPRWSRQSVNPPVEAPTSRQRRPAGSTPNALSAFASLIPPRETNSGRASRSIATSVTHELARLGGSAALAPTRTSPARTAAAARDRDEKSPRSASTVSRRRFGIAEGYPRVSAPPGGPHARRAATVITLTVGWLARSTVKA